MKLTWLRALVVAGSLAQFAATTVSAQAQQPASEASTQAREHFLRGQSAYSQGDHETAIAEWRAAYELDARPLILYNLSQAYERAGMLAEAVDALERYLASTSGTDPNVPTARNRLSALRERLGRTGILVEDAPAGAEIFVDDRSWGLAPRPDPIALSPGSHRVRLVLAGYEDFEVAISIPAGQTISVSAEMDRVVVAEERSTTGGVVMMAAGGGLVATAAVLGGIALGKAKDAEFGAGADADRATAMARAADVLGAVGIGAAAGGLVWFLVARSGDDDASASNETRRWTASPVIGRGSVGIDATVAF